MGKSSPGAAARHTRLPGPILPAVSRGMASPPPAAGPQVVPGLAKWEHGHGPHAVAGYSRFMSPNSAATEIERLEGRTRELSRLTRFTPSPQLLEALKSGPSPTSSHDEMLRTGGDRVRSPPKPRFRPLDLDPVSPLKEPGLCGHCGRGGEAESDDRSASSKWAKRQEVVELRKRIAELERQASLANVSSEMARVEQRRLLSAANRDVALAKQREVVAVEKLAAEEDASAAVNAALEKAHKDKHAFLAAVSPYAKSAAMVEMKQQNDELVAAERVAGQVKTAAALHTVMLVKKEVVALVIAAARSNRTATAAVATETEAEAEAVAEAQKSEGEMSLTEELEHWSQSWLSCGKMWQICGDCELCQEGGNLKQVIDAAREYKNAHFEECCAMSLDDLIAARLATRATPVYKLSTFSEERAPMHQVLNAVCRKMQQPDAPPDDYRMMYRHLKNAVRHLHGADEGERLYRGQTDVFGDDNEVGGVVTWKAFGSVSRTEAKARAYAGTDGGVLFAIQGDHPANFGAVIRGGQVHSDTQPPLAVGKEPDDEDTLLLPPGTSFLVLEDAVEEATGLRLITLMYVGDWLDSEVLEQPAVQEAQRNLEAAARTHRNALRIGTFHQVSTQAIPAAATLT